MKAAWFILVIGAVAAGVVLAQPAAQPESKSDIKPGPEFGVPGPLPPGFPGEHRLMSELTGNFNVKFSIYASPDAPPTEVVGAAVRRSTLGGRFLQEQLDVSNAPTPFALETIIGFNPDGKEGERFELMRLSSAAFPMMIERGSFDNPTKAFVFKGEHLIDGKLAKTRTVFSLSSHLTQSIEVYVTYEDASPAKKGVLTPEFKAFAIEYERARK
jgi:hypothetical protein